MQMRSSLRSVAPCLLAVALLSSTAADAWAQAGRIAGTVTDQNGQTVASARVFVLGTRLETLSAADGAFAIAGVHAGTYDVAVSRLGYRDETMRGVSVPAGGTAEVKFELTPSAVELAGIVVSATRQPERITDAPATISKIGPEALANSVGNSFNGAIKDVKGLQFIQVGMTTAAVNARGFNSSFNNRMLMMEDGRIAVLPENGLPLGQMTALPKIDLAGVEVLVGPGAALYGPDASNGVIALSTKSPREYSGTAFELAGGSKDYMDVQGRYAAMHGNFGYKVAGEYQYSKDWSNRLNYGTASAPLWEIGADFQNRVARGDAGFYWYLPGESKLEVTGGMSRTDGVGQTNVGRNQLQGWLYNFVQARWSNPHWYANVYRTESKAGSSYAINRYTQYKADPTMAGLSDDSIKSAAGWPSDGQLYAAELQNNFRLEPIRTSVVWGGQFRRDHDSSEQRWLTDRLTGKPIDLDQKGIYAQTQTDILPQLQLVLAGRYDKHDRYDAQFSPKAGLIFKPAPDQALRVTYNQAFKSPTTLQTDFYIPEFVQYVGVYGNANGFTVKDAAGATLATYGGLQPEKNRTWELGYKGVLAKRAYLDITGYRAHYENFMSPLIIIANPFAGGASATLAYDASGNLIQANGLPEIVMTYVNMGQATLSGIDAGLRYVASDHVELNGTLTLVHADTIEPGIFGTESNQLETTALNSTPVQWTVGATFMDPLPNFSGNFGIRHSTGYQFRSGINVGRIPTFNTLDVGATYKLPVAGTRLNLSIENLFTCRADYGGELDAVPLTAAKTGSKCGFGETHQEMVNMPYIGTMVFLGLQYNH